MAFNQPRPGIHWNHQEPISLEIQRQLDLEREMRGFQQPRSRDFMPRFQNINISNRQQHRRSVLQEAEVPQNRIEPVPEPVDPRRQADDHVEPLPEDGFLPPVSVSVKAHLIQDTAKVYVTQFFLNNSSCIIPKASYTFPLPHGCTVVDFICRIGSDMILKGKVKPKEEARDAFESRIKQNETAGLLDQNTPEIFTTTLGNIPANARLKVEISFIFLLKYNFEAGTGSTTFTLPIYIAPRFGTPPQSIRQALRTSTYLRSLTVAVDVLAAEVIEEIKSSSHSISIEKGMGEMNFQSWRDFVQSGQREDPKAASVHLSETVTYLDRDFVLEIRTRPNTGIERPHACVETHPDLENHRAVMLTIPPNFMLGNQTRASSGNNGEIIFLADRSGSMFDKMVALKSAMAFFLKGIPTVHGDRYFNIWCFGSDHSYLWPRSKLYSDRNMQGALNYVSHSFKANMGGTRLLPALKAVVASRGPYHATDIVTLTDGEVWDLDETLDFVKRTRRDNNGRFRFFCLGIGAAVSHALVEGIAELGGGYAEVIPLASHGGWESRVVAVLKATLTDHIGPISVEMEDQSETEGLREFVRLDQRHQGASLSYAEHARNMMQSPADVSKLSPFVRNRVFMLYESLPPNVPLDGLQLRTTRPDGEEVAIWVQIKALNLPGSTIHKLAARALLGDLERGQSYIHLGPSAPVRHSEQERQTVELEGERLGCKWSLVSKWTSFYAVKEPFRATETSQDPFIDSEDSQIEVVAQSDLDLLRPRGPHGNPTTNPIEAAETLEFEEIEDTDTDVSHTESETEGDQDSRSNDDDDDNMGGGGSGSGSGAPGGGHGDRSRDRDRDNGSNWRASNVNDDGTPPSDSFSAPTAAEDLSCAAPAGNIPSWQEMEPRERSMRIQHEGVMRYGAQSETFEDDHLLAGGVNTELISDMVTAHGQQGNTTISSTSLSPGSAATSEQDTATIVSPATQTPPDRVNYDSSYVPSYQSYTTNLSRGVSNLGQPNFRVPLVKSLESPTRRKDSPLSRGDDSQDRTDYFQTQLSDLDFVAPETYGLLNNDTPGGSTRSKRSSSPFPFISPRGKSDSKSSKGTGRKISSLDKEMFEDNTLEDKTLLRKRIETKSMDQEFDYSLTDDYFFSAPSREIWAPISNLPTSTAMLATPQFQAISEEERAKDAFIRRLLAFQSHNGSFTIPDAEAKALLGNDFLDVVRDIGLDVISDCQMSDTFIPRQVALATAIVAVLELQFVSRKTLWELMANKARDFINVNCVKDVVAIATQKLHSVDIPWRNSLSPSAPPSTEFQMSFWKADPQVSTGRRVSLELAPLGDE